MPCDVLPIPPVLPIPVGPTNPVAGDPVGPVETGGPVTIVTIIPFSSKTTTLWPIPVTNKFGPGSPLGPVCETLNPVAPAKPLGPVGPPKLPTGPLAPVGPAALLNPDAPTEPVAPVMESMPVGPSWPVAPSVPRSPLGPVNSAKVPVAPVPDEVAPMGPVWPSVPRCPSVPFEPLGPRRPRCEYRDQEPVASTTCHAMIAPSRTKHTPNKSPSHPVIRFLTSTFPHSHHLFRSNLYIYKRTNNLGRVSNERLGALDLEFVKQSVKIR